MDVSLLINKCSVVISRFLVHLFLLLSVPYLVKQLEYFCLPSEYWMNSVDKGNDHLIGLMRMIVSSFNFYRKSDVDDGAEADLD